MSTPPAQLQASANGVGSAEAHGDAVTTKVEARSFLRAHRGPILGVVAVLVVSVVLAARWWIGPPVATETVLRRDFVQSVVASGHVETPHRFDVGAQITGTVLHVPVAEGQAVQAGDLLVELDSNEARANRQQADAAVLQAQARLRQLQEVQAPVAAQVLRQAQSNLENVRAAAVRNQSLFERGFISQAGLDDTRKALALADAQEQAARKQLDTTSPSGSDRALAQANLGGAIASAQAADARLAYTLIRAPVAGTLIARNVEAGDVVQPGRLLMTLSPHGLTQVVVQIDEKNLSLLGLGQEAQISADAYPAQRFGAVLAYINPGVNTTTGAVEVKLNVPSPPAVLRQDMTVSVDIEVARRPKALVVPVSAVRDADGAAPWVLRVEGRRAVQRLVHLGLRSGGVAEVTQGLEEGDSVVAEAAALAPGARVRPVAGAAR